MADERPKIKRRKESSPSIIEPPRVAEVVAGRAKRPGRPTLEDATILTPEMEEVAQRTHAGYSPSEIADALRIGTDKVVRYLQSVPLVQQRIRLLRGEPLYRFDLLRTELGEASFRAAVRAVNEGRVPWKHLMELLERYDPIEQRDRRTVTLELEETTQPGGDRKEEGKKSIFRRMEVKGETERR